jgi:hypothetical protein
LHLTVANIKRLKQNLNMEKIKEKLEEKIANRKSIEDRIHADIRNGKDLVKKDLDAIFALSLVITTLEELLK